MTASPVCCPTKSDTPFNPSVSGAEAESRLAIKAAHVCGTGRAAVHRVVEGAIMAVTIGAAGCAGRRGKNERLGPFAPEAEILPIGRKIMAAGHAAAEPDSRRRRENWPESSSRPVQATAGLRSADPEGLSRDRRIPSPCFLLQPKAASRSMSTKVIHRLRRPGRMFGLRAFRSFAPDPGYIGENLSGRPAGGYSSLDGKTFSRACQSGFQTSTFQYAPGVRGHISRLSL